MPSGHKFVTVLLRMELNHLRYFHEVAKAGSFTAAARKLRVSQSALSKAVALLEASEGVKLLERSKKGVKLTVVGLEVFRMSGSAFQIFSEIEGVCRGTKEACEGYFRFGASDHVTNYLLAPKLHQMRRSHPKLLPSVFAGTPNDIVNMVTSGELEFGLFFTKVATPGIAFEPIASLPMAVVCHPRLFEKKKDASLSGLKSLVQRAGFIGSIKAQYQSHPSKDLMNLLGDEVPVCFESNSQETQKRFCLEGGGVAYLARFMVEKEIESGALVEIQTPKPLPLELLLAKRRSSPLSLSARTFLGMLDLKLIENRRG